MSENSDHAGSLVHERIQNCLWRRSERDFGMERKKRLVVVLVKEEREKP